MGKIGITLVLIVAWGLSRAQETRDFQYYNSLTYSQYLAGNWDDLLHSGVEALKKGYDYYYLRMRLGIACYNKRKFRQADRHFRRALDYDTLSVAAKEYLYYTNLLLGREQVAQAYYDIRETAINPFFYSLYLEGGFKGNTEDVTATRNTGYGVIGLRHQLSRRVRYFHAYQRLVRSAVDFGQGSGQQSDTHYQIRQHAYYGRLEILAGQAFWVIPAFHYQDWSLPGASGSDWLASLGFARDIGLARLYTDANWSRIANEEQFQVNAGLVVYPLGNLDLYLDNLLIYQYASGRVQFGGKHMLGGKLANTTWLQAWYAHGPMRYFSEHNAFVVFNTPNRIDNRWGFSLLQSIGNHTMHVHYIRESKTETESNLDFVHNNIVIGFHFKLY